MSGLIRSLLRFRVALLACVLLATGWLGYELANIRLNGDFSTYLSRSDPAVRQFNLVGERYGSKSIGIVVVESSNVFDSDILRLIRDLTAAYEQVDGVAYVTSLTNVLDFRQRDGSLEVGHLIGNKLPESASDRKRLRDYVLSREMYVRNLVSSDGRKSAIVIRLAHGAPELSVTGAIRQTTLGIPAGDARISFGGFPFMMDTLTGLIVTTLERLEPVMLLLMVAILYVAFRRPGGVLIPLMVVGLSTIWAVGLMSMSGHSLNMITGIMPVILIALGSADAIHVMRRYYQGRREGLNVAAAIEATYAELEWPLVITTLTTSVGFLSLLVSDFSVIAEFGWITTLALFLALAITLTVVPAVLSYSKESGASPVDGAPGRGEMWMQDLADRISNRKHWVLGLAGILGVGALAALPLLSTSVDWTLCYAKGSPAEKAEMLLRRDFGGTLPIQVLVRGDLQDPAVLQIMRSLERDIDAQPKVSESRSIARLLSEMNWVLNDRFTPPGDRSGIANLWFLVEDKDIVRQLVRNDRREGLIEARVATWDTSVITQSVDAVKQLVARLPRKMLVMDLARVPANTRLSLLALRSTQVTTDLVHDLAGAGLQVPETLIAGTVDQLVEYKSLSDVGRLRLGAAARQYLASDEAELSFNSDKQIAAIAGAVADTADASGDPDPATVVSRIREVEPDADPSDVRALSASLTWLSRNTVSIIRLQRALTAIEAVLPAGAIQRPGLERKLAGTLWQINSRYVSINSLNTNPHAVPPNSPVSRTVSLSYEVTGLAEVLQHMERELVPTQVWSLLLALVGVAGLLGLMFRSAVVGLVGVIPIALTIAVNFGVMALLGIGLDSFTAMIASVAIGLGIDYAVHFLASYRHQLHMLGDERAALRRTFSGTGIAIVINSITVGAGFAVLLLAPGQHVQRFGGLVALTMLLGAVFTLALMPVFTSWLTPAFLRRRQHEDNIDVPGDRRIAHDSGGNSAHRR